MSVNFPAIHIISVTKNAVNPQIRDDRDPVFHMKHVKKKRSKSVPGIFCAQSAVIRVVDVTIESLGPSQGKMLTYQLAIAKFPL